MSLDDNNPQKAASWWQKTTEKYPNLAKYGIGGVFLFFLGKGLIWLAIFMGVGKLLCN